MMYVAAMPKPPTLTVRKLLALTPALAQAIEDFRFAQRINSESEAIRRLIARGLQAERAAKPRLARAEASGIGRRRRSTAAKNT